MSVFTIPQHVQLLLELLLLLLFDRPIALIQAAFSLARLIFEMVEMLDTIRFRSWLATRRTARSQRNWCSTLVFESCNKMQESARAGVVHEDARDTFGKAVFIQGSCRSHLLLCVVEDPTSM